MPSGCPDQIAVERADAQVEERVLEVPEVPNEGGFVEGPGLSARQASRQVANDGPHQRDGERAKEREDRPNSPPGESASCLAHVACQSPVGRRACHCACRPSRNPVAGLNPRNFAASVVSAQVSRTSPGCGGRRRTRSARPASAATIPSTSLTLARLPPATLRTGTRAAPVSRASPAARNARTTSPTKVKSRVCVAVAVQRDLVPLRRGGQKPLESHVGPLSRPVHGEQAQG